MNGTILHSPLSSIFSTTVLSKTTATYLFLWEIETNSEFHMHLLEKISSSELLDFSLKCLELVNELVYNKKKKPHLNLEREECRGFHIFAIE